MKKIYYFKKIDSTSTYLKNNYQKHDNLTFVFANYQTKGHGRNNRKWYSYNKKDLLFSILIKNNNLINKYSDISLASAACIYEILKDLNIKNISIKWPNDIYVNDKKIAGILLESISYGKEIEALVVGIGVNVNSNNFPDEISNVSTSIVKELGFKLSMKKLKKNIFLKFMDLFNNMDKSYLKIIRENNYLKDKEVYANIGNEKKLVKVIDVNDDNSLIIKKDDEYINISSGEITFHL